MTLVIIYWMTLILCCAIVAWVGERDEKVCIAAYAIASILSARAVSPMATRLRTVEWPLLGVDVLMLLVFLVFVVRSRRYWPLWTTGIQVVSLLGNTAVLSRATRHAYAMTLAIMAYGILSTLLIAALRSHLRRRRSRMSDSGL